MTIHKNKFDQRPRPDPGFWPGMRNGLLFIAAVVTIALVVALV